MFVVIKPAGSAQRSRFTEPELRPLLRQAVVATAAAVESYVADKACCYIGSVLKNGSTPRSLLEMPLTLEQVMWVEETYTKRGWGRRKLVTDHIAQQASSHSHKVGKVFALVGVKKFWPQVDHKRGVKPGISEKQLNELADRRNRIVHTADRLGGGRATLEVKAAQEHFDNARSIVDALESVLPKP